MLIELPAIPTPMVDVVQDDEGYSAEVSAERALDPIEYDAMSRACLRMAPVIENQGQHQTRGLVSVDDEMLWVYVHVIGPGRFGSEQESAARLLLENLWRAVHEAAASQ